MTGVRYKEMMRLIVCALAYSRVWLRVTNPIRAKDQGALNDIVNDAMQFACAQQDDPAARAGAQRYSASTGSSDAEFEAFCMGARDGGVVINTHNGHELGPNLFIRPCDIPGLVAVAQKAADALPAATDAERYDAKTGTTRHTSPASDVGVRKSEPYPGTANPLLAVCDVIEARAKEATGGTWSAPKEGPGSKYSAVVSDCGPEDSGYGGKLVGESFGQADGRYVCVVQPKVILALVAKIREMAELLDDMAETETQGKRIAAAMQIEVP